MRAVGLSILYSPSVTFVIPGLVTGLNFYFAHNSTPNYGAFLEGSELRGLPNAEASALG